VCRFGGHALTFPGVSTRAGSQRPRRRQYATGFGRFGSRQRALHRQRVQGHGSAIPASGETAFSSSRPEPAGAVEGSSAAASIPQERGVDISDAALEFRHLTAT
jgi:hypothetical protein